MLPYSFTLLNFWGVWPSTNSSKWKQYIYSVYTIFMIILVYTNTLSQIIDLFVSFKNLKQFINNAFILLSTIGAGVKAAHLIWQRKTIINLMKIIQSHPCIPQDEDEQIVQQKFNNKIKRMNFAYICLFVCTITTLTIASFFRDIPMKQLYYHAWIPFDYSSKFRFWMVYIHQVIAHGFDASLHAAYDTLAPAMMIQTCAQFELLNLRFEKLPQSLKKKIHKFGGNNNVMINSQHLKREEAKKIGECVSHHIQIIEFSKKNNSIFGTSIFLQYSVSSLVLCMSVLRLSQLNTFSPDLASVFLYLISMISQVFIPCFAGNQLTVQSSQICDAIYSMDWTTLTISTQKSLVLIMSRSQKPVQFISGRIIPLSMNSFNNVIRISYSIFNVLHGSSAI
ncbi:hypothetical protein HCN44_005763 [Aphidius gifuensis]|uniref:Odorant receptor n=1 Tax=Aphidius gifuensis TaxID=684658 RepID=A0A3Q9ELD9_APHGI|nr:putative odorant receptor 71a [Aphidius gifuensis]AZQ24897.1 odorant receptor [Aphidius gifuensis]KAF7992982.1 hypothetical protein HCN44_005763 [Aphidius gifuensis]